MRRGGCVTAVLIAALSTAASAQAATYQNPFSSDQPYIGRTDMGVDICLSPGAPIRAVGNGIVVGVIKNWSVGQPYIWYELTSGADAGKYVYVAEQIDRLAHIGQTLQAGDVVARYAKKGTCVETGWSAANGATMAQATAGYTEGQTTQTGVSFAHFLISLGVQGQFQLVATKARTAKAKKRHHRRSLSPVAGAVTPVAHIA